MCTSQKDITDDLLPCEEVASMCCLLSIVDCKLPESKAVSYLPLQHKLGYECSREACDSYEYFQKRSQSKLYSIIDPLIHIIANYINCGA